MTKTELRVKKQTELIKYIQTLLLEAKQEDNKPILEGNQDLQELDDQEADNKQGENAREDNASQNENNEKENEAKDLSLEQKPKNPSDKGILGRFENIILNSKNYKNTNNNQKEEEVDRNEVLDLNREEVRSNMSSSTYIPRPKVLLESKIKAELKHHPKSHFNARRDSDQELANILANVVFHEDDTIEKSPFKENDMSALMKDVDKIIETTKELEESTPLNI